MFESQGILVFKIEIKGELGVVWNKWHTAWLKAILVANLPVL